MSTSAVSQHPVGSCGGAFRHTGCNCAIAEATPAGAELDVTTLETPADALDLSASAYSDRPEAMQVSYEDAKAKVEAYKEELDRARENLVHDENWNNWLNSMSMFHGYSVTNQMLVAIQTRGKATRIAGATTWRALGRFPKKGEKALSIFAPMTKRLPVTDAAGNTVTDSNGKEIWEPRVIGFKAVPVFDVAQTDGEPLAKLDRQISEAPPEGFVEDMHAAAEKAGYQVEYRDLDSYNNESAHGWTDPRTKTIVVDSSMSEGSRARTLAHELGHVYAGHTERLGEYHNGPGGCRGSMEVEAESIGYALTRSNGMTPADSEVISAQYLQAWSRGDSKMIADSQAAIHDGYKAVMEAVAFRNADYERRVQRPESEDGETPKRRTARRRKAARK